MDFQGIKSFYGLPEEVKPNMKTEIQWAKAGYLVMSGEVGTDLRRGLYKSNVYCYYHVSQVRKASAEELMHYFAPEKELRREKEKKHREAQRLAIEQERQERKDQWDELKKAYHRLCEQAGHLRSDEVQNTARQIVIDTETTGLNPDTDELLQVSILDAETERVLYNKYFRPFYTRAWPEAEAVNHISPDMVADKPYFAAAVPELDQIMGAAETVIGYNPGFDINFLRAYGVHVEDKKIIDVMEDYAQKYGEYDEEKGRYQWVKLTECAEALGYDWGREQAHDSLADCRATLYCYKNI